MATIEEDFEYELGRINMGPDNIYNVGFEVKELLINNNELKQTLFNEFSLLKPKPKLKLYLNHFISDEVYWNARKNLFSKKDRQADKTFYWLKARFDKKCLDNNVEEKFCGRFIYDTTLFKILNKVFYLIEDFKKYVINEDNKEYNAYAIATSKNIISLLNKADLPLLKRTVLFDFMDSNKNIHLEIASMTFGVLNPNKPSKDIAVLQAKYNILRNFANAYIRDEIEKYISTEIFSDVGIEKNRTKDAINLLFNDMSKSKGWKYAFRNENDYNLYVNLLVGFFELKEIQLPNEAISLHNNCKTILAATLKEIYKECKEGVLKSEIGYFRLIRVLSPFASSTDKEIYNALNK